MRKLDFLSNSPQTFIFQKSSNKTRFGGILTIIYILFILIMAFVYFYDYYKNDKYIISYNQYRTPINFTDYEKDADPRYNPTLKFKFDVTNGRGKNLSDNLILLDPFTGERVERNKLIEKKVSETKIFVLYNCTDMICNIRDEDSNGNLFTDGLPLFYFGFNFSYYDFNFEDDDEPIKLSENTGMINVGFNPQIAQAFQYYWQVAKVTEELGILDRLIGKKKSHLVEALLIRVSQHFQRLFSMPQIMDRILQKFIKFYIFFIVQIFMIILLNIEGKKFQLYLM